MKKPCSKTFRKVGLTPFFKVFIYLPMSLVLLIQVLVEVKHVFFLRQHVLLVAEKQFRRDGKHALLLPLAVVSREVPVNGAKE